MLLFQHLIQLLLHCNSERIRINIMINPSLSLTTITSTPDKKSNRSILCNHPFILSILSIHSFLLSSIIHHFSPFISQKTLFSSLFSLHFSHHPLVSSSPSFSFSHCDNHQKSLSPHFSSFPHLSLDHRSKHFFLLPFFHAHLIFIFSSFHMRKLKNLLPR